MDTLKILKEKYKMLLPYLDEKTRRMVCAADAVSIGHGGVMQVHKASGLSRVAITDGKKELLNQQSSDTEPVLQNQRIRKEGGGRKKLTDLQKPLFQELELLVNPYTRGDPESPLRWTTKSLRKLQEELEAQNFKVSYGTVRTLLKEMGYSLQSQIKVNEGNNHPDRDEQFKYINEQAKKYLVAGQPVISVDTKKKELIGDFKKEGREYQPKGQPERASTHDFPSEALGKAIPYGVYDVGENNGWVSVGVDKDTAMFSTNTIRSWWYGMGKPGKHKKSTKLMVTADNGGSNGSKNRLWKKSLQDLANEIQLPITVCHFPPGTSKWNKIEHRMFSFTTMNWRGHKLTSYKTILKRIGSTTTKKGLKIKVKMDNNKYEKGLKISDKEFESLNIFPHDFHGDWNYTIKPNDM